MQTQTVRITAADHAVLRSIAKSKGKPMSSVLGEAIRTLQREQLLRRSNDAYALLKENTQAWHEEMEERKAWDATLSDGMD